MPLFAKLLVCFNILAAGAFVYLASIDYEKRQQWSYEVFRHELVLDGLPLDETDVGWRADQRVTKDKEKNYRLEDDDASAGRRVERPIYPDLNDALLRDMFNDGAAGPPVVRTQKEEVEQLRNKLKEDLGKLEPGARRERLKYLAVAQARTVEERDAVRKEYADPKNTTDQLRDKFLEGFDEAVSDGDVKRSPGARRDKVAHLLINLLPEDVPVPPTWTDDQVKKFAAKHQRVLVIIGIRGFTRAVEAQARNLRTMAERTREVSVDERKNFDEAYGRLRDSIVLLANRTARAENELKDVQARSANTEERIKVAQKEIDSLKDAIKDATAQTEKALGDQKDLEEKLFGVHKNVGELIEENRKLERIIRSLELGRSRGGRS